MNFHRNCAAHGREVVAVSDERHGIVRHGGIASHGRLLQGTAARHTAAGKERQRGFGPGPASVVPRLERVCERIVERPALPAVRVEVRLRAASAARRCRTCRIPGERQPTVSGCRVCAAFGADCSRGHPSGAPPNPPSGPQPPAAPAARFGGVGSWLPHCCHGQQPRAFFSRSDCDRPLFLRGGLRGSLHRTLRPRLRGPPSSRRLRRAAPGSDAGFGELYPSTAGSLASTAEAIIGCRSSSQPLSGRYSISTATTLTNTAAAAAAIRGPQIRHVFRGFGTRGLARCGSHPIEFTA